MPLTLQTACSPVSEITLRKRLSAINAIDQARLAQLRLLVDWQSIVSEKDKHSQLAVLSSLVQRVACGGLNLFITQVIDLRALVAALVARSQGNTLAGDWTPSQLRGVIHQHWQEPTFGLGRRYGWLEKAQQFILNQQFYSLEQLMMQQIWRGLSRLANGLQYDFTALAVYYLQWCIIDRWRSYQADAAMVVFESILDALPEPELSDVS